MPIITFDSVKLSTEQKRQLAEGLSEVAHKVTGITKKAMVVLIKENDRENIAVGGTLLADRQE